MVDFEELKNFEWVDPGRLARSSATNYQGHDDVQNLSQATIDWMVGQGIKGVASANQFALTEASRKLLAKEPIAYIHFPVVDYTAPTRAQLDGFVSFMDANPVTLVYCGFGYGRTGTIVTAWQIQQGIIRSKAEIVAVGRANRVEVEDQWTFLSDYWDSLHET